VYISFEYNKVTFVWNKVYICLE